MEHFIVHHINFRNGEARQQVELGIIGDKLDDEAACLYIIWHDPKLHAFTLSKFLKYR